MIDKAYVKKLEDRVHELEEISQFNRESFENLWSDTGELLKIIFYLSYDTHVDVEELRDSIQNDSEHDANSAKRIMQASPAFKWFYEHGFEGTPDDPDAPKLPNKD